jgi:hypothetical protein
MYHLFDHGTQRDYPCIDTVIWQEIRPWRARYWKTFPKGYKLQFDHKIVEVNVDEFSEELISQEEIANKWYRERQIWYTNYFKATA